MEQRTTRNLPASVARLGLRIEHWRRTRARRTAMPAELWSEATILAESEGAYAISRALGIGFSGLKQRLDHCATAEAPRPSRAFVELTGAQILGPQLPPGPVVELSDDAGLRLTVRLTKDSEVDLARLVAAFRNRSA